ncbi:MAG: amino acid transporter, partial [Thermoplasmata archaeon]|nr:amino acid transporter [Thermoplasmata archaeon]
MIILNLRGIKESVTILAPIFLLFIITHIILLGYGIFSQASVVSTHVNQFSTGLGGDLQVIGLFGILAIFLRAFS